ncbi:P-loop containing nucleoside triphosphate hydrolase protein [Bisporella sp. PMI_857]|nr:P-loop containing nucleoside triphosphate hydrolase protein [Bisporella sp. PMI_857]
MPEKVHTKFADAEEPQKNKQQRQTHSEHNPNGTKLQLQQGQIKGGKKRSRDGSPDRKVNALAREHDSRSHLPKSKKQKTGFNPLSPRNTLLNGTITASNPVNVPSKLKNNGTPQNRLRDHTTHRGKQQHSQVHNQQALTKIADSLKKSRQELPIASKKIDIRHMLRHNDVLLLRGETGSGKSTQTPQFLYTEPWCRREAVKIINKDGKEEYIKVGGMIAITQPRRVAATSLARRVAKEMGCSLDNSTKYGKVGYAVRFDAVIPKGTQIKFLTEGMLLQEMLRDPHLRQYSAVIVDEIHERSVDVDLIAGFLRLLLHGDKKGRGGISLKVIIMSATLDLGGLEAFFAKPESMPDYNPGENHGKTLAKHMIKAEERRKKNKDAKNATKNQAEVEATPKKMWGGKGTEQDADGPSPASSNETYSSWSGIKSSPESPDGKQIKYYITAKDDKSRNGNSTRRHDSHREEVAASEKLDEDSDLKEHLDASLEDDESPKTSEYDSELDGSSSSGDDEDGDSSSVSSLDNPVAKNGVATLFVKGRQYEVGVWYDEKPTLDYLDNMLRTVLRLHVVEPLPGDILCFLTGQEEIETLKNQLEEWASKLKPHLPRLKVLPLYGSLPASAQQEAFEKLKEKHARKVVLATNIAETSVTVSGVHIVIDCGKSKVKQYRPRLGMESLLSRPISMVSAIQRMGRAGREVPGKCIKLYTAKDEAKFEQDEKPEIMRCDIIEAVLKMKARGVDDILSFPLMDRPDVIAMEKALLQLHVMGAIDDHGVLTDAGRKMAEYPLPAAYGRVIVEAAKEGCLLEAIDIIACITSDAEIYFQAKSEEDQLNLEENRKLIQHAKGDILTYLTTIRKFIQEDGDRLDWCRKHFINLRALNMALRIRSQLRRQCQQQKLLSKDLPHDSEPFVELSPDKEDMLLKTFVKAFVSKTAMIGENGQFVTTLGRNPIHIHPSSVLYGKKLEAIMFLEHVFTAKSYGKKVSAIQANWIESALVGA